MTERQRSLSISTDDNGQQQQRITTPGKADNANKSSPIKMSPNPTVEAPPYLTPYPFDLRDYIRAEMFGIGEPGNLSPSKAVNASVNNFFLVPLQLEKLLALGMIISLDTFLYVLTFLPIRVAFSLLLVVKECIGYFIPWLITDSPSHKKGPNSKARVQKSARLHRTNLYDLLRGSILYLGYWTLCKINMSQLYHFIRGQNMIKLYVLTSMMEVCSTLLSSFGQDVFDILYSQVRSDPRSLAIIFPYVVVNCYNIIHSSLYFLHVATLTVVINSADSTLVTVLILNNFAELRSFVFKKYDRFYLFQLTCDDITERFRMLLFVFLIVVVALAQAGPLWYDSLNSLSRVALMMIFGEVVADSMKHAFINKFNKIEASSYQDYSLILRGDYISNQKDKIILDHTYAVTRRIGLSQIPLGCVSLRCLHLAFSAPYVQSYFRKQTSNSWALHFGLGFVSLVAIKLMIGVGLYLYARRTNAGILKSESTDELTPSKGRPRSNSELVNIRNKERSNYMQELAHINRYTVHKGRIV